MINKMEKSDKISRWAKVLMLFRINLNFFFNSTISVFVLTISHLHSYLSSFLLYLITLFRHVNPCEKERCFYQFTNRWELACFGNRHWKFWHLFKFRQLLLMLVGNMSFLQPPNEPNITFDDIHSFAGSLNIISVLRQSGIRFALICAHYKKIYKQIEIILFFSYITPLFFSFFGCTCNTYL